MRREGRLEETIILRNTRSSINNDNLIMSFDVSDGTYGQKRGGRFDWSEFIEILKDLGGFQIDFLFRNPVQQVFINLHLKLLERL